MSNNLDGAMNTLIEAVMGLKSSVDEYTRNADSRMTGMMSEVADLRERTQRAERIIRKIGLAIMEEPDEY